MAKQLDFDFSDGARLEAHLKECGLSPVQSALCGLILSEGQERRHEDQVYRSLRISQRQAAMKLPGTPTAVRKAAARVATMGFLQVVPDAGGRATLYILDVLAATSLVPIEERLDELPRTPVGTAGHQWAPVGTGPPVLEEDLTKTPCLPVLVPDQGVQGENSASGDQRCAPVTGVENRSPGVRPLGQIDMPWARRGGFSNEELKAAVFGDDLGGLQHAFDEAVSRGWIRVPRDYAEGSDVWRRFLMLSRRVARTGCRCKRAVMQKAIERGVDSSKCSCADEDWAQRMIKAQYRAPAPRRESRSSSEREPTRIGEVLGTTMSRIGLESVNHEKRARDERG